MESLPTESRAGLRIGWIGFHLEGRSALTALLDEGYSVAAVITLDEPRLAARSGAVEYDDLCLRRNVPLFKIRNINDAESLELLRRLDLDVAFVIGWSQIIGPEALHAPRLGMIGAHASLLPRNRGSAPVNWAILRGETEGGNTLIWLSEKVDGGEIIDQTPFAITEHDTCATVYEKVDRSNRDMILRLLPKLMAGERIARPQPRTAESLLPRRRPSDGLIDWTHSSREVYNFIRALTRPYPGAFSWLDGAKYWIWDAAVLPGDPYPAAGPGQTLGAMIHPLPAHACGQVVACGAGAIVILEAESSDGSVLKGRRLCEADWKEKTWSHEQ